MIHISKDVETADSASVTTDGIIIGGSVKSNGGNGLIIGGNVSASSSASKKAMSIGGNITGSYGIDINGVMKSISNTAIRINNTKNELYAINS